LITVVGSINLDHVVTVDSLPREGETLLAKGYAEHPGGKGANQAVAAARMGARVRMVGRIGADASGIQLRDALAADGVDVAEVLQVEESTGRAFIEVDAQGRNRIIVVPGANAAWQPGDVVTALASDVSRGTLGDKGRPLVLLQREISGEVVLEAARWASENQCMVVLNAAPAGDLEPELLSCVTILVVNEHEAALTLGVPVEAVNTAPEAACAQLQSRGPTSVVITLGNRGASFAAADDHGSVQGFQVKPVDTTAAGDAFVGAMAASLNEGVNLREAVRMGCAAGALAVTTAGAQPSLPERPDVERLIRTT